jgi:hypothetical protein
VSDKVRRCRQHIKQNAVRIYVLRAILHELKKLLKELCVFPPPAAWAVRNDNGLPLVNAQVRDQALEEKTNAFGKRIFAL